MTQTQAKTKAQNQAPLMLSISGLRSLVGQSLTPDLAARYGAAFGSWLQDENPSTDPNQPTTVVLGRDSRPSGQAMSYAVAAGLASTGCRVLDVGILSTPGVAVMVGHHHAQGGIVVTASHNPIQWNGIKPIRHDGVSPPPEQAQRIIDRFKADDFDFVTPEHYQPIEHHPDGVQQHVDRVLQTVDADAIRACHFKVVVDSVHGAGGDEAAALLDALGVERIHLYAEPTGLFPHTPEPTQQNLTELCAAVREHAADAGFAQDPDADRLAIVDEQGRYIGEEYTLVLCAAELLGQGESVAANLSTSRMIDDVAAGLGASVIRTKVGEANVVAGMKAHHAIVGGEGNGGIIDPRVSYVRDSIVGMALALQRLAKTKAKLSELVAQVPAYAIVKTKVDASPELIAQIGPRLRDTFADQKLDDRDGVRIDYPDRWVHVRPSNTEPIVRLIAEAPEETQAQALIDQASTALDLI